MNTRRGSAQSWRSCSKEPDSLNAGNRVEKSSFHFEVNHFAVAEWMNEYERFWNERLDQFERYFNDKKEKTEKGK
jgi:hypothetical protein